MNPVPIHRAVLPLLFAGWLAACGDEPVAPMPTAPYPASTVIAAVTFDWSTHERLAPGSDNWPLTWADDGHQYTSWGDGGGFGGSDEDFRVSLGFARVEGDFGDHVGKNVWGDPRNSEAAASFGGKTRTVLAVGDTLYFWRSPGSNVRGLVYQRLYRSDDSGASWRETGVEWSFEEHGLGLFAMLQFGRGYAGSRDRYVYIYASELRERVFEIQAPGAIHLLRVPADSLEHQGAYEFFGGLDAGGRPVWGGFDRRTPVFRDPNGVLHNSAIHNPGLGRYLLVTSHSVAFRGNLAIFDAPEPWGPWTTVMYEAGWPRSGEVEPTTFFANFSAKWSWGEGGRDFVFVFTGIDENDSWNAVRGRFRLGGSTSG